MAAIKLISLIIANKDCQTKQPLYVNIKYFKMIESIFLFRTKADFSDFELQTFDLAQNTSAIDHNHQMHANHHDDSCSLDEKDVTRQLSCCERTRLKNHLSRMLSSIRVTGNPQDIFRRPFVTHYLAATLNIPARTVFCNINYELHKFFRSIGIKIKEAYKKGVGSVAGPPRGNVALIRGLVIEGQYKQKHEQFVVSFRKKRAEQNRLSLVKHPPKMNRRDKSRMIDLLQKYLNDIDDRKNDDAEQQELATTLAKNFSKMKQLLLKKNPRLKKTNKQSNKSKKQCKLNESGSYDSEISEFKKQLSDQEPLEIHPVFEECQKEEDFSGPFREMTKIEENIKEEFQQFRTAPEDSSVKLESELQATIEKMDSISKNSQIFQESIRKERERISTLLEKIQVAEQK